MHYRAKLPLKIGGWYKTQEGAIYKIAKCASEACPEIRCHRMNFIPVTGKKTSTLCGDAELRSRLIYYCTDEEITFYSL